MLTIAQPGDYHHLQSQLANRWPSLAAYVVSFAVIGIMWLNHHSIFTHFARVSEHPRIGDSEVLIIPLPKNHKQRLLAA